MELGKRPSEGVALGVLMALSVGCYSGVDIDAAQGLDTDAVDAGGTGDPSDAGTAGDTDDGVPAGACAEAPLGTTPLRRLTNQEYRNSLRDIFEIEPPTEEMLPPDARPHDFRTTTGQGLTPGSTIKYFDAARFAIERRTEQDPQWFPCAQDDGCVDEFLAEEGRRLFRRPLAEDEVARYHAIFTGSLETGNDVPEAAGVMLQAMLVSPQFLFVELPVAEPGGRAPLDDWQLASRLSFLLWASSPDDELLDDAAAGTLADSNGRTAAALRMLEDPRAKDAMDAFFMQWTTAENISLVSREPELYPDVVPEVVHALEEETRLFFREVFWNRGAGLDQLFTSEVQVRNGILSAYYGDGLVPADQSEFTIVDVPPGEKAFGMLSQAGILMSAGRNPDTQIIYRGSFVQNKLLCRTITLTATDQVPPLPEIEDGVTSRARIEQHTAEPTCAACHAHLNPPGFALEHFDPTGRWRDDEDGLPIDASATLVGVSDGPVDGARGLAEALAESDAARACAVDQMFEFTIGREPMPDDACVTDELLSAFVESGDDLQALLVEIIASEAFAQRVAPTE